MKIDRRRFLAGCSGVAGVTAAGCLQSRSNPPSETNSSTPGRAEGVEIPAEAIDITEHGADPTGETSVVPTLESVAGDGDVIHFPSGEYRFDETWSFDGFEQFAMLGPKATIVPSEGFDSHLLYFQSREPPSTLRFEGFTFDFTAPETGGRLLDAQVASELTVRDITATGTLDVGDNLVRVDVTDPNGSGLVERLSLPDGADPGTEISGCYVGNRSRGDIRFTDCLIEGFPDNGLYADPPAGRMIVSGGRFANNGISNVRVRGDSLVENVHVRCDSAREGFENMRGIRLTNYSPDPSAQPAVVRNCRVELTDVTESDAAVELSSDLPAAEIYDTQIHVDVDNVPAIRTKSPTFSSADRSGPTGVHCQNVHITGSSGNQSAVYIVERDGSLFDSLCVHQTGPNQNGIELLRSTDNTVQDSYLNVTGEPILHFESTSEISSLRTQPVEGESVSLTSTHCTTN